MHTLTARELHDKFAQGDLSAIAITRHFLERIHLYDRDIGAFLSVYPERALACAKKLDLKRSKGQTLGQLAAVPVAIKDNIHVQGQLTTCASQFLAGYEAPFDATAVKLLEDADAIIIGKTNMDEFAMGSSTENSALQLTVNPWNFTCSPGGSSGGSAAAVAARLVPLALGSDTGGSIRQPASFCGIAGFKPTHGKISSYGLVAFAPSLDQIGPFATCCSDIALAMDVLNNYRHEDSLAAQGERFFPLNRSIHHLKIGVPWQLLAELTCETHRNFMQAIEHFKTLGAKIVEVDLNILKYSLAVYSTIACAEASTNLVQLYSTHEEIKGPQTKTAKNEHFAQHEKLGPEVQKRLMMGNFVLAAGHYDDSYDKAQKMRVLFSEIFQQAFSCCHLIAMPTTPFSASKLGALADPLQIHTDMYTIAANLASLPAISIPSGFNADKMPLGLQLIGPSDQDITVLNAAYAFESTTSYHKEIPSM